MGGGRVTSTILTPAVIPAIHALWRVMKSAPGFRDWSDLRDASSAPPGGQFRNRYGTRELA